MERNDRLVGYPHIVVRIRCDRCNRDGAFRLARLAAKYGADYPIDQLLADLAHKDCGHRPQNQRKGKRWAIPEKRCQAYFPDLVSPRPPDLPTDRSVRIGEGLRIVDSSGEFRAPRKRSG